MLCFTGIYKVCTVFKDNFSNSYGNKMGREGGGICFAFFWCGFFKRKKEKEKSILE